MHTSLGALESCSRLADGCVWGGGGGVEGEIGGCCGQFADRLLQFWP